MKIYSKEDFAKLRVAGKLAASVLDYITPYVKAGVSTLELNDIAHEFIIKNGAESACLNYQGYPKSVPISVNDVICHGIPSKKEILKDGDILNIDVTVIKDGYFGDTSRMYTVGNVSKENLDLIKITYDAMMKAISIVKPGVPLSAIGKAIESVVLPKGYGIVKEFAGHGIGTTFHEEPNILHYYANYYDKIIMKEGMVFTIEPMINLGKESLYIQNDGWIARTKDGKNSAQFEHMVGVTKKGCEIFTLSNT
ncbi:MAG: type I methionyl aminopeptidase [Rickettsiales bacterium]|jgi:methionyl aminopeptidase|nr:type I methionyl aminopeptidase [Rickettsiales bacterium]